MRQYILLIHDNTTSPTLQTEWNEFFNHAKASGHFQGGSEVGHKTTIGPCGKSSAHIAGFMRFDCDDHDSLLNLLKIHPVFLHGGTIELCDLPKS
jgi:hypothetical protein